MAHNRGIGLRLPAFSIAAALGWLLLMGPPCSAQSQPSLCADCHFANQGKPNPLHLLEWDSSPHARAGIGCERCHGGDPDTVESFLAHQRIVRGSGPETPLHPASLPRTCGSCHRGAAAQFQKSRHSTLLAEHRYDGPTCSTCHGYAAGYTLSPNGLEKQCNACHGRGKKAERAEYAADARAWLEAIRDVRTRLDHAHSMIARLNNVARRDAFEQDVRQATAPLTEAVQDGHAFVFAASGERLALARARVDALMLRLASEPPPSPR